jgi:hypothetical protein
LLGGKTSPDPLFVSPFGGRIETITLTSDQITINESLDIEGPGASLLAISGNDANRGFDICEGLTVTIAGLMISHGRAGGSNGSGGILNVGSALDLANDAFSIHRNHQEEIQCPMISRHHC